MKMSAKVENSASGLEPSDNSLAKTDGSNLSLKPKELEFLRSVFSNSVNCIAPVPQVVLKDSKGDNFKRDLYIATISTSLIYDHYQDAEHNRFSQSHVDNKSFSHYKSVTRSGRFSLLTSNNNFTVKEFSELHKLSIQKSANKLHKICNEDKEEKLNKHTNPAAFLLTMPEMAYPFPLEPGGQFLHSQNIESVIDEDNKFQWAETYLIAGTQHDHNYERNIAVLDFPFKPREHVSSFSGVNENVSMDRPNIPKHFEGAYQESDRFIFYHSKFSPASKLGEKLRPPEGIEWKFYQTPLGYIGILICFDAYDPRILLRLAAWEKDKAGSEKFTAIIVPTFSRNDDIRNACKMLSELMQCMVIYTNTQYRMPADYETTDDVLRRHDDAYADCHGLFFCGDDLIVDRESYDDIFTHKGQMTESLNTEKDLWFNTHFWHIDLEKLARLTAQADNKSDAFKRILGLTRSQENE